MAPEKVSYTVDDPLEAMVVKNQALTRDDQVHRIVLDVGPYYSWQPGQATRVLTDHPSDHARKGVAGMEDDKHIAAYSIASKYKPERPRLVLLVRRSNAIDPASKEVTYYGRASNDLCDAPVGSKVKLLDPITLNLVLSDDPTIKDLNKINIVGIFGGTGLSPILPYLPERSHNPGATLIIYGTQDPASFLERQKIEAFARNTPSAKVMVAYSSSGVSNRFLRDKNRPDDDHQEHDLVKGLPDISFQKGVYVDKLLLAQGERIWQMVQDPDTYFLFCGGPRMLSSVENAMADICKAHGRNDEERDWKVMKAHLLAEHRWRVEAD